MTSVWGTAALNHRQRATTECLWLFPVEFYSVSLTTIFIRGHLPDFECNKSVMLPIYCNYTSSFIVCQTAGWQCKANRTGLNFSSEILTFMLGAYKEAALIDSQWLIKGWITGREHWLDIFPKRGKILGVCQQSYYSNSMFFFTCLVNGRCHRESILK